MAKGSFEKKGNEKGILEHQEGGKNNTKYESMGKYNRLSPFEFFKLCLTVKQKLQCCLLWFLRYIEEIFKTGVSW